MNIELRDYFAGKIIQPLIEKIFEDIHKEPAENVGKIVAEYCSMSFLIADVMLKERGEE